MLVKDILGRKDKKGDVGLELEVEADEPLPVEVPNPWKAKAEGSLRGKPGCQIEYYTQGAVEVDEHKLTRIKRLTDVLNKPEQKTNTTSPRTSFHVHCNVLNFTPKEVWAAATLYWLVEDAMMDYCGDERKGNMFCLRLKDAEAIIDRITKDVFKPIPFTSLGGNNIRYSGLNLNSLPKFGTLEFRGMRGTTDPQVLDRWSTAVHWLVQAGRLLGSPQAVLDEHLKGLDLYQIVVHDSIKILGDYNASMDAAALRLSEFAYLVDWDEWEAKSKEYFSSRKPEEKPRFRTEDDDAVMEARPIRWEIPEARVQEFFED